VNPLHVEVLYSGDHNLSCFYMAEVVKVVASSFKNDIKWEIVYVFKEDGARRYYNLSVGLYGEDNVRKKRQLAPVPSIIIDGRLVFESIPLVEDMEGAVRELIREKKLSGPID